MYDTPEKATENDNQRRAHKCTTKGATYNAGIAPLQKYNAALPFCRAVAAQTNYPL